MKRPDAVWKAEGMSRNGAWGFQGVCITSSRLARPSTHRPLQTATYLPSRDDPAMAPSNPLANWDKLGDSFYRRVSVYDAIFDEDVELENYLVTGAPYGGAIGRN